MPPRKSHRKSRNGCDTCRQRRVKCDEQGPPCTGCTSRGIDCRFSRRLALAPAANSNTPTQSTEQHLSTRRLELELLHYYSTRTYQGFALLSPDQGFWQVFAVEQALKFGFLMKEIFALAALHKATETPESALKYVNHALEYQNEALALSHPILQNINQENSGAVFIFSIMTMIFEIVPPESVPGVNFKSPLENILALFEFQKGTASLVDICRNWLESSQFRWIFGFKSPNKTVTANDNFHAALTRLEELNNDYTTASTSDFAIFSNAIGSLSFCSVGSKGRILAWLAMAGQDFLAKLKDSEPMALLILLHWAVLLETLGELWWAKNAGKRLVEDVAVFLEKVAYSSSSSCGPNWEDAIGWARLEAGIGGGGEGEGAMVVEAVEVGG